MFASPREMRAIVCKGCPTYLIEERNPKRNHGRERHKVCKHYVKVGKFLVCDACSNENSQRYAPSVNRIAINESCTHGQAVALIKAAANV